MEKVKLTDDQVNILDLSGLSSQSLDEVMRRAKVQKEINERTDDKKRTRDDAVRNRHDKRDFGTPGNIIPYRID